MYIFCFITLLFYDMLLSERYFGDELSKPLFILASSLISSSGSLSSFAGCETEMVGFALLSSPGKFPKKTIIPIIKSKSPTNVAIKIISRLNCVLLGCFGVIGLSFRFFMFDFVHFFVILL